MPLRKAVGMTDVPDKARAEQQLSVQSIGSSPSPQSRERPCPLAVRPHTQFNSISFHNDGWHVSIKHVEARDAHARKH
jgi:hypothetical protein